MRKKISAASLAALSKELDSMRKDGRTKKILEQYVTNADEFLEVDVLEK